MKLYRPQKQMPRQRSLWRSLPFLVMAVFLLDTASMFLPGAGGRGLIMQMLIAAQYYTDFALGVDTNNGTSWATPMKTLDQATKLLGDGDWVYCAESPAPTSIGSATWTAGSRAVTVAAGLTQLIYACDGTTIWNKVDANCTPTQRTTMKEGTHSASLAIGASATTGVMATANLNADLDCSGYQQISFWVRSSAALTANYLALAMYSDDYPGTAMTHLTGKAYIPAIPAANLWQPVTVDYGGALGTVRTIALIAETDPGTVTVLIDDILACKASSADDSLTLTSLISKNTAGEPWFAIGWINGTSVGLESINAAPSSTIGSYGGSSGAATTYKRETLKTTVASSTTTAVQTINDGGTAAAPITISGGYTNGADVTVEPAAGHLTFFSGANGNGYGIYGSSKNYVFLSRLAGTRYYSSLYLANTCSTDTLSNCHAAATTSSAILMFGTLSNIVISDCTVSGPATAGVNLAIGNTSGATASGCYVHGSGTSGYYTKDSKNVTFSSCYAGACQTQGFYAQAMYGWLRYSDCTSVGASISTYGLQLNNTVSQGPDFPTAICERLNISGNTSASVYIDAGCSARLYDSILGDSAEVNFQTALRPDWCYSTNHDGSTGSHYLWEYGATYNSTQGTRHTASGWAWQLSPTNATRGSTWPLRLPIGQVALKSGVATTVTAWMQRSNTSLTGGLVCPGGQIAGITSDVSDTSWTVAAGEWEQQSITLSTQTEDGVVTVEAQCYGGTTYSLYVDDISCNRSQQFKTLDWGTGSGPCYLNLRGGGGW